SQRKLVSKVPGTAQSLPFAGRAYLSVVAMPVSFFVVAGEGYVVRSDTTQTAATVSRLFVAASAVPPRAGGWAVRRCADGRIVAARPARRPERREPAAPKRPDRHETTAAE